DMRQFRATFFEEAAEHLTALEQGLLRLEGAPQDPELLNSIFRAAHSIKGASATFGLEEVARFTHGMEGLLDQLREGGMQPTPHVVESLLRGADVLAELIAAAKEDRPSSIDTSAVEEQIQACLGATSASTPAQRMPTQARGHEVEYEIRFIPHEQVFASGMDPALLILELATLGDITSLQLDTSRLPAGDQFDPCRCYLGWTIRL